MSIGKASDFQIYNEQFIGGFVETIQQNVDGFNAATAGGITLQTAGHIGDYYKETFFDVISSLVTRRDTTSIAAVTDLAPTTDEFVGVKRTYKIGPVANTLDAWRKIGKDQGELSFVLG
ncbi:MAG: major capsid protein, partial [Candidatus Nanopelagicales bacterium]